MTRSPLLVPAVAAAPALGACGGSDDGGGSTRASSKQDKAFEGALKYARCMRERGVDVPDPQRDANGGVVQNGPTARGPNVKAAEKACGKYLEAGGGIPDPQQLAEAQDAMLRYARCMRGEGIDMPDPKNGRMEFKSGPGGGPDSPRFKAADRVCHRYLAEGEKNIGGIKRKESR
jgi:hypothetical protein